MTLNSPMISFLAKKIMISLLILFLATWMVSVLMHSVSVKPKHGSPASYLEWIENLVTFRFATRELFAKTFRTLMLTFGSLAVSLLFSIPLGISSAIRNDSIGLKLITKLIDSICFTPAFVTAYLFILLGLKIFHQHFAAVGEDRPASSIFIMFLALGLSNGTVSEIMRHAREETIRILEQNYYKAVISRGVNLKRHFTKSLFLPLLNIVSSRIVYLLSGAVVIEFIFGVDGIGKWSWDSAIAGDYSAVMNITFIMVLFVLLVRLSDNLMAAYIDSRRR